MSGIGEVCSLASHMLAGNRSLMCPTLAETKQRIGGKRALMV
jgi:hypothetical protein